MKIAMATIRPLGLGDGREARSRTAATRHLGVGRIFVPPAGRAVRIRTGETSTDAF